MGLDSIANSGSVPAKDFGKKKRANRLAKLKQCKLDARREQWLSQAKNKGSKKELKLSPLSTVVPIEGNRPLENLETMRAVGGGGEETEGLSIHDSDLESLVNSSSRSLDSRKDRPWSSCGSTSSSGCCSGNFSEEEDDDGCLDDWEAIADALSANDEKQRCLNLEPISEKEIRVESNACQEVPKKNTGIDIVKPECRNMIPRTAPNNCAWRPDDAFRPQSLPNLAKQNSFTMHGQQRHLVRGSNTWVNKMILPPLSCPICYEDLDFTDSSFMPCICGFRLCLFCHKKIFDEGDARCPGCRRPYDPIDAVVNAGRQPVHNERAQAYGLARSCSMSRRSLGKVSH